MKNWFVMLCATVAILLGQMIHAETVYKWNDSDGKVIYSQTPPPSGTDYVIVEQRYNQSTSIPQSSSGTFASLDDGNTETAGDQDTKPDKERLAESQKIKDENCAQVKKNLNSLNSRGQVTIKDGDLYRKLTEEERQEKISENEQLMKEFCN